MEIFKTFEDWRWLGLKWDQTHFRERSSRMTREGRDVFFSPPAPPLFIVGIWICKDAGEKNKASPSRPMGMRHMALMGRVVQPLDSSCGKYLFMYWTLIPWATCGAHGATHKCGLIWGSVWSLVKRQSEQRPPNQEHVFPLYPTQQCLSRSAKASVNLSLTSLCWQKLRVIVMTWLCQGLEV